MADIYKDESLTLDIFNALRVAGKDKSEDSVVEVLKALRDAYFDAGWTDDPDLRATRIRIEVLARAE